MKKRSQIIFYIVLHSILFSCNNSEQDAPTDSPLKGTIHISVDESFKPVIDEQIKVYESSYPNTRIIPEYKSEADCFRDFQEDSTRMIIVAKGLTEKENSFYTANLSFKPQWDILAFDAVSVIVNIASKDSIFTLNQLQDLLIGKDTSMGVVMDGKNATSSVRYLQDSMLKGQPFGANVQAAAGSKAVLDYISRHENAVGFIGSSWVGNQGDPEQVAYSKKIKLALVECKSCEAGTFAKPSQSTITYMQYPLVRPLYYILKENYNGLGTGFRNFMNLERGQLVFKRSYLAPAKIYFGVRTGNIQ